MKRFLRIYALLFLCMIGLTAYAAETTFIAGTNTSSSTSLTVDDVTLSITGGSLSRDDNYRVYANQTLTISSDYDITSVVFTYSSSSYANLSLDSSSDGSYSTSGTTGTWTGTAKSISFSGSSQSRITQIVVTYSKDDATVVKKTTFSVEEGTYTAAQSVTITQEDGATIYYSTDGEKYSEYKSAIEISKTTTLYAYAQKRKTARAAWLVQTYTIVSLNRRKYLY